MKPQKPQPLMMDEEAVRIIDTVDYDFSTFERKVNPISRQSWIARSLFFDERIKEYLHANPDGTVINIGCGLDTTFERVNNGKVTWYELDFPDVIATRESLVSESPQRKNLAYSVLDDRWYDRIKNKENVLILMAGVIYYFSENEVMKLFNKFESMFARCTILFDYSSLRGVSIANKVVIEDGGMDQNVRLIWGVDDLNTINSWSSRITIVENMRMFAEHRKRFPVGKRLGMWISDALAVMSLARVVIG